MYFSGMGPGLRLFDLERDDEALAALLTASDKEPVSVADVHDWFGNEVAGAIFHAVMPTGGAGYAEVYRQPWQLPGQFTCRVVVGEADRRRGLGSQLLAEITRFAASKGAGSLRGSVREACTAGRAFARSHGFTMVRHLFESRLDPRTVDPSLLTRPAPPGVVIAAFDELGDTGEHRRMHWQLNERLGQDQPGDIGHAQRSFAAYTAQVFDSSWFRAAGQFIAISDQAWVGIGAVGYFESTNSLYHMFTGVEAAYRGRGIGSALKRASIAYALDTGAAYLLASNDSTNAPMLAINKAFGYVAQPGLFDLQRSL